MGVDRYSKDDEGFRKYVELLESTPTAKRKTFLDAAKAENPKFAEAAEKYVLTFERIMNLPDLELTEVLGAPGLKPEHLAIAILSVEDLNLRAKLLNMLPRELAPKVQVVVKDGPKLEPYNIGGARLQIIQAARGLEKRGMLKSVQIPRFGVGHFSKKFA